MSSTLKLTQQEQLRWRQNWLELKWSNTVIPFMAELDDRSTRDQGASDSGSKMTLPSTTGETCPSVLCSVCTQTELSPASLGRDSREGAVKDVGTR